ncbi:MAG TPA: hypothetical protein VF163_21705 [Micromonosporaceae bacterium]
MLNELTESYGHLKLAAGHAAGGAAEKLTPGYDRARSVAVRGMSSTMGAVAPLYVQVREGAANARRGTAKPNRWPAVFGLVAGGLAVGAAGAMVVRRRRSAAQWEEYEPAPGIVEPSHAAATASHKVTAGAASVAEGVSAQAGRIAESLHSRAGRGQTSPPPPVGMPETGADLTGKGPDIAGEPPRTDFP